jgi:hypothetical protein
MNTQTKQRGRPKGAVSTVNITLRQLNELFNQDIAIPVGAVFLREYGISVEKPAPLVVAETVAPVEPEPQIQFSVTRFDEEREELPAPPEEIMVGAE